MGCTCSVEKKPIHASVTVEAMGEMDGAFVSVEIRVHGKTPGANIVAADALLLAVEKVIRGELQG